MPTLSFTPVQQFIINGLVIGFFVYLVQPFLLFFSRLNGSSIDLRTTVQMLPIVFIADLCGCTLAAIVQKRTRTQLTGLTVGFFMACVVYFSIMHYIYITYRI